MDAPGLGLAATASAIPPAGPGPPGSAAISAKAWGEQKAQAPSGCLTSRLSECKSSGARGKPA